MTICKWLVVDHLPLQREKGKSKPSVNDGGRSIDDVSTDGGWWGHIL